MTDNLSTLLRSLLRDSGLTQRKLAVKAGIDRGNLNRLLNGKRDNVTLGTIKLLAKALNVNPAIFLEEKPVAVKTIQPFNEMALQVMKSMPVGIPLYSDFKPNFVAQTPETYLYYRPESIKNKKWSAFRVHRNYFSIWIMDNDTIIIDEGADLEPGNIVVYIFKGEVNCGKLMIDNSTGKMTIKGEESYTDVEDCVAVARIVEVIKRV